eukprot:763129-Hanusia_phi.AAC.11
MLELNEANEQVQVVRGDDVVLLEERDVSLPCLRLGDAVPQHVLQPDPVELRACARSDEEVWGQGGC